jgi:hypothetical protein
MNEPGRSPKPVDMNKAPAHAPQPGKPPRIVVASAASMAASGVAGVIAAIGLYGQHNWLSNQVADANASSVSKAVSSAAAKASSAHSDVAQASASASSSALKKWPTSVSGVHDQVSQQQTSSVLTALVFFAAVAFISFGVYRGRHWSRWGVIAFWFLTSLATPFGVAGLLMIGGSAPAAYKAPMFLAGLCLTVGVVLANMPQSVAYFALSRPPVRAGAPARRGLFMPRTPPPGSHTGGAAAGPTSPIKSSAVTRGEAFVQKQRAKKRAANNAEAVARGAELARSRAKASKSRRSSER